MQSGGHGPMPLLSPSWLGLRHALGLRRRRRRAGSALERAVALVERVAGQEQEALARQACATLRDTV